MIYVNRRDSEKHCVYECYFFIKSRGDKNYSKRKKRGIIQFSVAASQSSKS